MRRVFGALIVLAIFAFSASGAVFQYTVAVPTEKGESEAFLWIPPQVREVRGVVMAATTLMERECVKDARIRQTTEGIAVAVQGRALFARQRSAAPLVSGTLASNRSRWRATAKVSRSPLRAYVRIGPDRVDVSGDLRAMTLAVSGRPAPCEEASLTAKSAENAKTI